MSVGTLTRRAPRAIWPVVAVGLATLLVLTSAPVLLRGLVALPVLVLVPGHALSRLLIRTRDDQISAASATVLRTAMPVLLGVLVLLGDALLLNLVRLDLRTRALVLGDAAISLLLLGICAHPALRPAPAEARPQARDRRIAVGAVVTLGLLIGALATARALQPAPVRTPYLAVQLISPGTDLVSAPGDSVSLGWTVTGFDGATTGPAAVVTVGGSTPEALRLRQSPRAGAPMHASASFTAPSQAGAYRVDIRVGANTSVSTVLTVRGR